METKIKLETEGEGEKTIIKIDNSTEFKNLRISNNGKDLDMHLNQQDLGGDKKGAICLEIGEIILIGREVELLKEFLNQF